MIGEQFGNYSVIDRLGAGGMGEVFRGVDRSLGREVAIKVLPSDLGDDPERVARFEREARTLAALQHENVASIYGFETLDNGKRCLVMELAAGEELAERLGRGRLDLNEAIAIALQIARGLEAAHGKGIVHRDLKPANLKIDAEGQLKILDFGLARPGDGGASDMDNSPTITSALTQAGTILGTAAYMSPEQARGKRVDHRADLWAFGVILWEMLTGERLFRGDSVGDVLSGVLREEIRWEELPSEVPPWLRRLLERLLRRNPRQRLQSIGDARLELEEGDLHQAAVAPTMRLSPVWLIAALALGVVGGALLPNSASEAPSNTTTEVLRSRIALPEGRQLAGWSAAGVAISPDGRSVAVVTSGDDGHQSLSLVDLVSGRSRQVEGSDGAEGPFFSPDGRWVAFGAGAISGRSTEEGMLKKVAVGSGDVVTVTPLVDYFGGFWGVDDTIYWIDRQPGGLHAVSADGSGRRQLRSDNDTAMMFPQRLPGVRQALVTIAEFPNRPALVDLDSGEIRPIADLEAIFTRLVGDDTLVFVEDQARVKARRFDLESGSVHGPTIELFDEVSILNGGAAGLAISSSGSLVHGLGPVAGSGREQTRLVRVSVDGSVEALAGFEPGFYQSSALSPDGQSLAFTVESEIVVLDFETGSMLDLPSTGHGAFNLLWSPNGERLVFSAKRGNSINLFSQAVDGIDAPRQLEEGVGESWAETWHPLTGELLYLAYDSGSGEVVIELRALDIEDPKPRVWQEKEAIRELEEDRLLAPRFSADGRWLAFTLGEPQNRRSYVQEFPAAERRIPLGEGWVIAWSIDGDAIYLAQGSRRIVQQVARVPLTWVDGRPLPGTPEVVLDGEIANRFVTRGLHGVDRQGFLTIEKLPELGRVDHLEMVQGFAGELDELLP